MCQSNRKPGFAHAAFAGRDRNHIFAAADTARRGAPGHNFEFILFVFHGFLFLNQDKISLAKDLWLTDASP